MGLSGQGTISIEWCLVVLTLNFVVLRLVSRLYIQRDRVNIGDVVLTFAWMSFAAMAACDTWLLKLGLMSPDKTYNEDLTHISDDPAKNIKILKIVYGSVPPYYMALWLVKCALLSFYYTIIPSSLGAHRIALHVVTGVVLLSMVAVQLINILWCMPISRNWSLSKSDVCFSFASIPAFIISTSFNILTDIAIFVLPFPLLRNIKLQRRSQIIGLSIIFGLGGFTMLASVVRVVVLANSATVTHVAIWSAVEVAVGIMVAVMPSLRILWRRTSDSIASGSRTSRNMTGPSASRTLGSRGPHRPTNWINLEEGEGKDTDSTRSKNRDTIKSHSTVLTVPTIEELEEIITEKQGTPPVRSIDDLQRFHDSVLFHRDPSDPAIKPCYEWSFDKVQWRYNEPPVPPSPICVNGLGVIPDIATPTSVVHHSPIRLGDSPPLPIKTFNPSGGSR